MNLLNLLIAAGIGVAIWTITMTVIRAVANPPPAMDPADTQETLRLFRCSLCGTEVTMTVSNRKATGSPRHCREEMDEVPAD